MLGDIGAATLRAALLLSLWGLAAAGHAAWRRDARSLRSAQWAALATFALSSLAALSMVGALLGHDFSLRYVALNNARETPPFYSAISLWGALEGSILLWTAILAGAAAWVAWRGTRTLPRLATTALTVLFGMLAFFLVLDVTAADPFVRLAEIPANGRGPNALLQNHPLMALHPPLLYLGYVLTRFWRHECYADLFSRQSIAQRNQFRVSLKIQNPKRDKARAKNCDAAYVG